MVDSAGRRYPGFEQGVLSLMPRQVPFQHRLWRWIYDRAAFVYDTGVRLTWSRAFGGAPIRRESYLQDLSTKPGDVVLETACGTAENLRSLPLGRRYVGLDISLNMLLQGRRKLVDTGHDFELIQGDGAHLPFQNDVFDLVFHMGGLQFIREPNQAIAEMHRAATPGGAVWIIDEKASLSKTLARSAIQHTHATLMNALKNLAPAGSQDIQTRNLSGGELYCLSFIKNA